VDVVLAVWGVAWRMRDDTLITKIEQMKEIKQAMGLPIAGSLLFAKSPVSPSFRTPFRERFQPRHKSLGMPSVRRTTQKAPAAMAKD